MKKRGKRAQSAMEYLLTYGWAILVVLIVLSLLFYLGVFSPKTTGSCVITAPFVCRDYMVNENSVGALLGGKEVSSVTVNSINVNGKDCVTAEPDGMGGQLYSDTVLSNIEYGGQAWVRCVGIKNNIGEKTSVDIDLDYFSKSGLAHSITGYVSSSGESGKGTFDYTHVLDNSIVLSYDFEEMQENNPDGNSVKDLSGYENDGTTYVTSGNIICNNNNGKYGKGCLYNPIDNQYINVFDDDSLDLIDDITIEAWMNTFSTGAYRIVVSKSLGSTNPTPTPYNVGLSSNNNQLFFSYNTGGTWYNYVTTNYNHQEVWVHVVWVIDASGDSMEIFVNGEEKNVQYPQQQFPPSLPLNDYDLTIGRSYYSNQYFNGYIDSLVIYNKALSQDEIKDHFCYTEHSNPTYQQFCSS